ncbi:MAG: hypothetical protein ACRENI_14045 [Gemmatimonadaceae bacterium]
MRSTGVLFPLLIAATLSAACSRVNPFGSDREAVSESVSQSPELTMEIATTQLQHHGYEVARLDESVLITTPRTVPDHLRGSNGEIPAGTQWFLRVEAEDMRFLAGTSVNIRGYLLPQGRERATNQLTQNAQPVTSVDHPDLFREVETSAAWIIDAVNRR